MVIPRYAGIGTICPLFTVELLSGGQVSAAIRYFSFQLQNRCGFNLPSTSDAIAIPANSKIRITIPESIRKPAWDIHYFIVSCGSSADASTHVQIARVPGYQYGTGISPQSILQELPYSFELTKDVHIALAPSMAAIANLPTGSDRIDGQVRFVVENGFWFEYRADSALLTTSPDVVQADFGQWVRIGGASTYVSNLQSGVGCDRSITTVNPVTAIPTPLYPALTRVMPDWEAKYWIYNNDSYPLSAGTEFGIELEFNNKRSPDLLAGLFMVRFLGFVRSDGTYRTEDVDGRDFPNLGGYFTWNPRYETPFVTIDDLQPGEAIALGVKPYFSVQELNNQVPPKSIVGIIPVIRTQSGDYNPLGKLIPEGVVYAEADKYRVVPGSGMSIKILPGMALVGGYDFPEKPARFISSGLSLNNDNQKVIINGNAAVFIKPSTYVLSSSEAIRAIVSTKNGESSLGIWSDFVAVPSGQGIKITVNYPCDINGNGTVRTNYPDVIALNTKGKFNPARIKIYLQRRDTKEIRLFSGFLVIPGEFQEISLSAWLDGTAVNLMPINDSVTDFSLFAPSESMITPTDSGIFPVNSYRCCYSFEYTGSQITKISHLSPPCIKEFPGNFEDIFKIQGEDDSIINALIYG